MIHNHNSLNVSPDGELIEILDQDFRGDKVWAKISVPLRPEQVPYFKEHLGLGHVITCINSVKARLGIDQKLLDQEHGGQGLQLVGTEVYYTALLISFRPEYLGNCTLASMFSKGMPVGKLYVQNPALQLQPEEAKELVSSEQFRYSNPNDVGLPSLNVYPDGTVMFPIGHAVIKTPDLKKITRDFFQAAMLKEISRADLEHIMERGGLGDGTLASHLSSLVSCPILSIPLCTSGYEMVITDPRHGDSRVAEADTGSTDSINGDFYIELVTGSFGPGQYSMSDLFLRVKFYRPITEWPDKATKT